MKRPGLYTVDAFAILFLMLIVLFLIFISACAPKQADVKFGNRRFIVERGHHDIDNDGDLDEYTSLDVYKIYE